MKFHDQAKSAFFYTYLEFLFERESDDTMVCGAVYGGGGGL